MRKNKYFIFLFITIYVPLILIGVFYIIPIERKRKCEFYNSRLDNKVVEIKKLKDYFSIITIDSVEYSVYLDDTNTDKMRNFMNKKNLYIKKEASSVLFVIKEKSVVTHFTAIDKCKIFNYMEP